MIYNRDVTNPILDMTQIKVILDWLVGCFIQGEEDSCTLVARCASILIDSIDVAKHAKGSNDRCSSSESAAALLYFSLSFPLAFVRNLTFGLP